jgi:hypothetical protein
MLIASSTFNSATTSGDTSRQISSLDYAQLRPTRWGQAVDVYGHDKLERPEATTAEIQTAKNTLFQIVALFADTEKISKKYRKDATYSASDVDAPVIALHNKMRELAMKQQNDSTFLKTTSWAIYHRSELKHLIDEIIMLIDNLEKRFPAAADQVRLAKQEVKEIPWWLWNTIPGADVQSLTAALGNSQASAVVTSVIGVKICICLQLLGKP